MKRKLTLAFAIILVLVLCVATAACNKTENATNDNVCRLTRAYFAGESDSYAVSIECGRREKLFIADGKATDVVDFVQLTVTPLKKNDCESLSYVISGENAMAEGTLDNADYGAFTKTIELDFTPLTVTVTYGEQSSEIELCDVLEGKLTSSDAINIAKDTFKQKLEEEKQAGKGEREIYVKLITGDRLSYYYYVSFIGDGVDYLATLIDPVSGEVISSK